MQQLVKKRIRDGKDIKIIPHFELFVNILNNFTAKLDLLFMLRLTNYFRKSFKI